MTVRHECSVKVRLRVPLNAGKDFGIRIRQNLEVLLRAGQSLATSATSVALFLRVKILNGGGLHSCVTRAGNFTENWDRLRFANLSASVFHLPRGITRVDN